LNEGLTTIFGLDIVPFDNAFVVKRISGSALLAALENSVSNAHTDGRFLQFSGLRLVASWHRPEGLRVLDAYYVPLSGPEQKIDQKRSYTIAMVSFIASGFDGYTWFKDEETLVSEEGAMTDTSLMLQIFRYSLSERCSDDAGEESEDDETSQGIERARKAIIVAKDEADGLPIVGPAVDGRIRFVREAVL
jgi:5'-nucleotidase, C-terminal domain